MKPVIIIAFAFVLFVPVNVFAVDFVDSSGYTPSWAKGNGYHTVLVKCTQVSGDSSSDSYWCLEWMAYVLDQGIENFPESTSEVSSSTIIDPDDLVKGDLYFGSLTKFLPPDSSYEKSLDPNLVFQPDPNSEGWIVGSPYWAPTKETEKSLNAGLKDHIIQEILIPDISGKNSILVIIMVFEFENNIKANEFFEPNKELKQNQIKSQSEIEDIFAGNNVYFDDCFGESKNYDLPDESAFISCIIDRYVVTVASQQSGGYVTDKYFDYVLTDEVVKDIARKIGKNIDGAGQTLIDEQSGGITISDEESCITLISGAWWNNGGCIAKFLVVEKGEILTISKGASLFNSEGTFKNSGTINVLGAISNWGSFENFGTINVSGQVSISDSSIINKGTIMINDGASVVVMSEGTLDNFGTISNNDELINHGIINNHCDGVILGNPVGMTDFGVGKIPIKQIPCGTIPEKVEPEITSTTTPEVKTTTEPETVFNTESEGGGCLIATATYGSELSPQVQQLRELRDNSLLQTQSGQSFMESFNSFYYSFSPTIADYERENPVFKEAVKITITPLVASLSLLNYVDMDSEESVLGYGIGIILMNVGMYFVAPTVVIQIIRNKKSL